MAQLTSVPSFPILFPGYIAQQEETILFKGRQYGDSYDVLTNDGHALFTVDPLPSLGRRMKVLDAYGKNIFCTRKETFHIGGSRYFVEKPSPSENTNLLTMEFKLFAVGTKFNVSFNNAVIQHRQQLCFDRGYFDTEGIITDGAGGPVIALVERKIILLRKEYRVVVAPGVDVALIAGLIVCLDDQEKSHKNAPALGGGRWG
jgi:uncharacterized protein YxjI